jgi:hypothetical protein
MDVMTDADFAKAAELYQSICRSARGTDNPVIVAINGFALFDSSISWHWREWHRLRGVRMASNQVATTFTAAYWIGTVPLGMSLVNYSAPWFWIGWIAAVLFFDIPLTAILWIMVLLARFSRFNILGTHFAAIGTAVPALYASYMMAGTWNPAR